MVDRIGPIAVKISAIHHPPLTITAIPRRSRRVSGCCSIVSASGGASEIAIESMDTVPQRIMLFGFLAPLGASYRRTGATQR
jgi:hypothetical protein